MLINGLCPYECLVSKEYELEYIKEFVTEYRFDDTISRDQLCCLWTAYCLHFDQEVDTAEYDSTLMELWNSVAESDSVTSDWNDYESFNNFMCKYIV